MADLSASLESPTRGAAPEPPPPGVALVALALMQLRQAITHLARDGESLHEGVHQARKSMRRARAALALGGKALGPGGRSLDEALGRLCRGLSPLRDAQDDALLLRHCGSRSPFPPPLRAHLRHLGRERLRRARAALGQA